jgi:hypothetical protein
MEMDGGILAALEHSWFGETARTSVWIYPAANVGHILALTVFAASVAMMDARLLGAFRDIPPGRFLRSVRSVAIAALAAMLLTGSVLFTAEATHVSGNPVFQIKLALIGLALLNAVLFELFAGGHVRSLPARTGLPAFARLSAALSLGLWFSVAAAGRLIAYF